MKVSVVVIAKNEGQFIDGLLEALSKQSHHDFELIFIDNSSFDKMADIVNSFNDQKIKYFYEPSTEGFAYLRNFGISKAQGNYIFFTDGDCFPDKHWIEEGLAVLEKEDFLGLEGKTYYESQSETTVSDYNTRQFLPGEFMTCNIAYRKDILEKVNYFDPKFKYGHEDRDLAYRVLELGKIGFCPQMLVAHQKKSLTVGSLFRRARWASNAVDFIKKHKVHPRLKLRILFPERLLIIIFPFVLIFTVSYRSLYDFKIGFFKYLAYIYERILIWRSAIRNRIFII